MAARRRPTAVERTKVPDVLGAEGREAQIDALVSDMLAGIQRQRVRAEVLRNVNDHEDDDLCPPDAPGMPMQTYKALFARLEESEREIAKKYPGSVERIEALVKERAAAE